MARALLREGPYDTYVDHCTAGVLICLGSLLLLLLRGFLRFGEPEIGLGLGLDLVILVVGHAGKGVLEMTRHRL
jgi:hypothetical protein